MHCGYAVQTDSEAHHIILMFRETAYAGGIEYMAHYVVVESALQQVCAAVKVLELTHGIVIHHRIVGCRKVTEYRDWSDGFLSPQYVGDFGNVLFQESETVHPGVELYMHGIICQSAVFGCAYYLMKNVERVNLRFEVVGEECTVVHHPRVEHHYRHGDSRAPQFHTFVEHGHRKIGGSL